MSVMTRELVVKFINNAAAIMAENKDYLVELDAFCGDGDLGLTMSKGFAEAARIANESAEADLGKLLFTVGSGIAKIVPSTMGTLMGSGILKAAKALKGKTELTTEDFAVFCECYYAGLQERGKANPGERTILDSLKPAADAARAAADAGEDFAAIANKAYEAALQGVEATKDMVPVYGKAVVHRAKLVGIADQGAIVGSLFYKALTQTF
ncbi:MAG: dihydroxyacetone kinase subunit L [Oscillospiraceae bacterium]|nr:dihydroxyacetone kinase subunit L [Oscillospiraceae bacterium]